VRVLAIDPGSVKCGVAVVERGQLLHREIVARDQLLPKISALRAQLAPDVVLLGDGTQSKALLAALPEALLVPEAYTSQRARERLRRSLPWWRRVLPLSAPYDDLVAVILAEDWLAQQESQCSSPNTSA
jgi:hypothetical protein